MEPSQITVSLEMAKKLKEAGWPQEEALYFWDETANELYRSIDASAADIGCIAAPTAEEILRQLPPSINMDGKMHYLRISDDRDWVGDSSWDMCYSEINTGIGGPSFVRGKSGFCEVCAKMWIYLKSNNLLPC